jgi:hypothetical protein
MLKRLCNNLNNNSDCKKFIIYKTEHGYRNACKNDSMCKSCASFGKKCSEEIKRKISKGNKGKNYSDETRKQMSESKMGNKNPMYGKKHTEKTLQKLRKPKSDNHKKTLSNMAIERFRDKTNHPMYGVRRFGEKNPNWNSILTDEERQEKRKYEEYRNFIKKCMKRDNYVCQISGQVGGKLAVHHLKSYKEYKELRTDINNGITVSEDLHKKIS